MHDSQEIEIESYEILKPGEARVRFKSLTLPNAEMGGKKQSMSLQKSKQDRLNVAIASAVTANARLRLLAALEAVGERLIYCDTDSIYYLRQNTEPSIFGTDPLLREGRHLGDWELEPPIQEMCVAAKKTKCIMYKNGKKKMSAKGITLTHANTQKLTHETMIKQVQAFVSGSPLEPIETKKRLFERVTSDPQDYHIRIRVANKMFQPVYDSRVFGDGFKTYPRCHPSLQKCAYC